MKWLSRMFVLLFACTMMSPLMTQAQTTHGQDLPRRPFLGLQFALLTDEVRARESYTGEGGYLVQRVLPASGAIAAGVEEGSILLSLGGHPLGAPGSLSMAMVSYDTGDTVHLVLWKGGAEIRRTITLTAAPQESSEAMKIEYGAVSDQGRRFRTIVTRPKDGARHPALFLIQGLGCFSVDEGMSPGGYGAMLYELTRRGFVTMRVDKPGTGDSEGGPCPDADFQSELRAYRAALLALKADPGIEPDAVFLFGHSMGGVMAPILAAEIPVRGVIVYGTAFRSWLEYDLENTRRQLRLEGRDYDQIDSTMRRQQIFDSAFYIQGQSLGRIVRDHPEFAEEFPDTTHMYGKPYRYFQQIYALNLPHIWKGVDSSVLAVWATSDFLSSRMDHEQIADAVNSAHPGRGSFLAVPETDHWFNHAASQQASMQQMMNGEPNHSVLEEIHNWMKGVLAPSGPSSPEKG